MTAGFPRVRVTRPDAQPYVGLRERCSAKRFAKTLWAAGVFGGLFTGVQTLTAAAPEAERMGQCSGCYYNPAINRVVCLECPVETT